MTQSSTNTIAQRFMETPEQKGEGQTTANKYVLLQAVLAHTFSSNIGTKIGSATYIGVLLQFFFSELFIEVE